MEVNKNSKVVVFGGNGHMGKIAVSLFQKAGYDVLIIDPTLITNVSCKEAIQQARILYFSVFPIEIIANILEDYKQNITSEHIIIDNASIKNPLLKMYSQLDATGVSVCSSHPLVKHDQSFRGQTVLLLPFGKNSLRATDMAQKLYESVGMKCEYIEFEEHDKFMVIVQLIPHLIMRTTARMFDLSNIDIIKLSKIAPANFQLFMLSMFRTVVQDPKISAKIIASLSESNEAKRILDNFQNSLLEMLNNRNEESLLESFKETTLRLNNDNFALLMNEKTIIALDRLTNLSIRSIVIVSDHDSPGLLIKLLVPFANNKINLTAIDSHKDGDYVRFEIGIDATTSKEILDKATNELILAGYDVSSTIL
ncbi:MAG: prephenate dehydrogenase/arogenate dehydrogenase family protein [bacterium]|nr:prephenate dehydrogenase/arogenate dehydrogenase family protein [bacterium]